MPAPMTLLEPTRTVRAGNRRGGREIVAAYSADGVWAYEHGEESTTPWHILHIPTGRWLHYADATLASARRGTASGWVLAELDRRDARQAQEVAA